MEVADKAIKFDDRAHLANGYHSRISPFAIAWYVSLWSGDQPNFGLLGSERMSFIIQIAYKTLHVAWQRTACVMIKRHTRSPDTV